VVRSISITGPVEGHLGLCEMDLRFQSHMAGPAFRGDKAKLLRDQWRKLAWDDVLDALAGSIAELRWKRAGYWGVAFTVDYYLQQVLGEQEPDRGGDFGQARFRLLWAFPDGPDEAFRRAWFEANDLVAKHWSVIRLVGRQLHAKGRLDADELYSLPEVAALETAVRVAA
jgi:hypothetical protein